MGRRNQNRPLKASKIRVPIFPLLENCNVEDPEEMAIWALVGLPGMKGAPLPLPEAGLRKVSQRLWALGFRYHPELRTLKYRRPRSGDPHFLTNPGTWVDINEPEEDELTPEEVSAKLSEEQKAALRKRFGLDAAPPEQKITEKEDDKVPYYHKDGTVEMAKPSDIRRYNNARRIAKEHLENEGGEST